MKTNYCEYELIVNKAKKYNNYLLLHSATLLTHCRRCDKTINEYVAGGVVFEFKNEERRDMVR